MPAANIRNPSPNCISLSARIICIPNDVTTILNPSNHIPVQTAAMPINSSDAAKTSAVTINAAARPTVSAAGNRIIAAKAAAHDGILNFFSFDDEYNTL